MTDGANCATLTYMTSTPNADQIADEHQAAGHEVMVRNGVIHCDTCRIEIDDSGARPGLIEANQSR